MSERKEETVMAVSVAARIPEFWEDEPRVWFTRAEAVLKPLKAGDAANFDMVVSKLPKAVILQITDFLANPPAEAMYRALKDRLLEIFEDSKEKKLEKLGDLELGEQKATQLLRRMKELAGDGFPEETLKIMWKRLLPPTVRAVLATATDKDLHSLAVIADSVLEATRSGQVAAVAKSPDRAGMNAATEDLVHEVARLNARLRKLETPAPRFVNKRRNGWEPRDAQARGPTRNTRPPRNPNWLCYYHYKFGKTAEKCIQPCAWKTRPEN